MTTVYAPSRPTLLSQVATLFGRSRTASCGVARAACPTDNAGRAPCHIALQLEAERERGRDMEKAFSQYVSPQLIELCAEAEGPCR